MILYSLSSSSLLMDVYEDRVVFHPKLLKGLFSKEWDRSFTIHYSELQRVDLNKRLWPQGHQLCFYTQHRAVVFTFRDLVPFYERLVTFFARQTIRYYNHPEGLPASIKTVPTLVEEKRRKKRGEPMAA